MKISEADRQTVCLSQMLAIVALFFLQVRCTPSVPAPEGPYVVVLGIAQDAGVPQADCRKTCCAEAWRDPQKRQRVACLGIVDPRSGQRWLIDATPDFKHQLWQLNQLAGAPDASPVDGIFLTHAHIGHYTGLMQLGHEVIGARGVPVYAMPRMLAFLSNDGPWDQLVRYGNIQLMPLLEDIGLQLNDRITVTPIQVPHRDEYSETVGYRISGPRQSVLFIPDIDKWEKWQTPVEEQIARVDAAFLDGTFFSSGEVGGRDMSEFPHPFIRESMQRFAVLPETERQKIVFIHLNHSNPALVKNSIARAQIEQAGHRVAQQGERFGL